ncbi:hypothetical protein [Streptomyces sp. HUAS TT20]|uniref:hypothetical protein n=1 Tax=Streptomyces sp. HUAS TT20 TaxID=3447509 RepID=UPI0021DB60CA|nr:hypothetical protein [Streptomyces sp. HUAS 15-9]UXY29538.1 hypothetical protein N8I87_25275 [Streptomyces sp. HUAS 15-9]
MVRRPVAWVVAVVLFAEGLGIAALNWFLGVVVDRQEMSLAGLDPDMMSMSSKIGGVVFGLYFALCALVALLVAIRNRAPAGFGRVLLISIAVVHGLLGAFTWGLVGWSAFLFMMVVLGLIVLLLMTYDRQDGAAETAPGGAPEGGDTPEAKEETPKGLDGPQEPDGEPGGPKGEAEEPQDDVPALAAPSAPAASVTPPAPTTP